MIPTATKLMQSKSGDDYTHWEEIHDMMIEFAKLHVEAALKAAVVNTKMGVNTCGLCHVGNRAKLLNAYPLTKIK